MIGRQAIFTITLYFWVVVSVAEPQEPNFVAVQTALFAIPGSLSNAWADVDGDGDLDLAVSTKSGAIELYQNDQGVFTAIGAAVGLPTHGDEIRGLSWGDFDLDGDPDLFAGSNVSPIRSRSYVYRNDGARFREVAHEIALAIPGRAARQSNWVDFDADGDLDLYAADRAGLNWLYRNNGLKFERLPFGQAPIDPRRTVGACWFDFDQDGDLDLFLANQNGDSDALWRNDGRKFTDVAPELGIDQTNRLLADGGVGCAVGDYDNDGDFDLYVSAYGDNLLYRNDRPDGFQEVAAILGVTGPVRSVGAAWGDYDNDGDLDLMSVGYTHGKTGSVPMNHLYRNDGGSFTNVLSPDHELNVGDHGVAWVDYDGDGDLDLSVTDGYGPMGGHPVFRNDLATTLRRQSLQVLVLDDLGRYSQQGAEVRLLAEDGSIMASRLVETGGGYNAQNATPVHFGLPNNRPVDVEVTFMSQFGRVTKKVTGVVPGLNTVVIRRAASVVDTTLHD